MHRNFSRLGAALFVTLIAVGIGVLAYQAGFSHGLALQIPAGTAAAPLPPYAYYYGWYRPRSFGLFGPFFSVLFWLFVVGFNLVGTIDLVLDYVHAIRVGLPAVAGQMGVAYAIPVIYVPLLMITHVAAFYLLLRPQHEATLTLAAS